MYKDIAKKNNLKKKLKINLISYSFQKKLSKLIY